MGRPKTITPEIRSAVIQAVDEDGHLTIRTSSQQIPEISRESIRKIRHSAGIHFYAQVAVPDLTEKHKLNRMKFADEILKSGDQSPILFTDESSVEVDLSSGGIWRRKSEKKVGSTYITNLHPLKVMVWGGVTTEGFKKTPAPVPRFHHHTVIH